MAQAAPENRIPSPDGQADDPLIAALRQLLGERLSTARAVREHHGKDASYHAMEMPDAVAFATGTEEVAALVRLCAAHKRPVIAFGPRSEERRVGQKCVSACRTEGSP